MVSCAAAGSLLSDQPVHFALGLGDPWMKKDVGEESMMPPLSEEKTGVHPKQGIQQHPQSLRSTSPLISLVPPQGPARRWEAGGRTALLT